MKFNSSKDNANFLQVLRGNARKIPLSIVALVSFDQTIAHATSIDGLLRSDLAGSQNKATNPVVSYAWPLMAENSAVTSVKLASSQSEQHELYLRAKTLHQGKDDENRVMKKDYAMAAKLYKLAADRGYVLAQTALGRMHQLGTGLAINNVEAARLYKLAAAQNHIPAQAHLAYLYEVGAGVEQDLSKAISLYRKAADKGDIKALNNLGYLNQNGIGLSKNLSEAIRLYQVGADKGDKVAQTNLGNMYRYGEGVAQDPSIAATWYELAVEQGYSRAQNNLANLYELGLGVEKDNSKAAALYRAAAEQGFDVAQQNLGEMYSGGRGVLQDFGQALSWYSAAAEQGNVIAQFNVGYLYNFGKGTEQNYVEALKWYQKSAAQNDDRKQKFVRTLTKLAGENQEYADAKRLYELVEAHGLKESYFQTAQMLKAHPNQALILYQAGAALGDKRAQKAIQQLREKQR